MKVKASIKKLCEACRIVKRRGKLYVVCKDNPKVKLALDDAWMPRNEPQHRSGWRMPPPRPPRPEVLLPHHRPLTCSTSSGRESILMRRQKFHLQHQQ